MRVNQLALSQAVLPQPGQGRHPRGRAARRAPHRRAAPPPRVSSGVELHELICELHRHGLTPFSRHGGHVQAEREREMFRLRAVEGLTLAQIGGRFDVSGARVRQLLKLHFGLDGVPPAARRRRSTKPRPSTVAEHRRLYLLARAAVQRYYHKPLTLKRIARAIASSPARCSVPTRGSARTPSATTSLAGAWKSAPSFCRQPRCRSAT